MSTKPEDLTEIARIRLLSRHKYIDITPNYFIVSPYYLPPEDGYKDVHNTGCTKGDTLEGTPVMASNLAYAELPRSANRNLQGQGVLSFTHLPHQLYDNEKTVTFKVDEGQSLLAMVTAIGIRSQEQVDGGREMVQEEKYFLRFIHFPDGDMHPQADNSRIVLPLSYTVPYGTIPHPQADNSMIGLPSTFTISDPIAVEIQIQGNNVAVLLDMHHLYIYNWETGLARAQYSVHPQEPISGFSFISDEVLLVISTSSIGVDLLRIPNCHPESFPLLHNVATLLFPEIHRAVKINTITCTHFSPAQLTNPSANPGTPITFALSFNHKRSSLYKVVNFVAPHGGLLKLWDRYKRCTKERVPWSVWGPAHTAAFDATYGKDDSFNLGEEFLMFCSDLDQRNSKLEYKITAKKIPWPQSVESYPEEENFNVYFRWKRDGVFAKSLPVFAVDQGQMVQAWLTSVQEMRVEIPHKPKTVLGYGRRLFAFEVSHDRRQEYTTVKNRDEDHTDDVESDLKEAESDLEEPESNLEEPKSNLEKTESETESEAESNMELDAESIVELDAESIMELDAESNMEEAGSDMGEAGSDMGEAGSDMGEAGSDMGEAGSDMGEAGSDMGEAGSDMGEAGSDMEDIEDAGYDTGSVDSDSEPPIVSVVVVYEF